MRPVPYPDRDSQPWWDAVMRHELVLQRCDECDAWRWPPRALCGRCASLDWSWQPWSGRGTVVSAIRTHRQFLPDMPVPFWTVFVAVDEQDDLLMPGSWHADGADPSIGMRVRVHFDDLSDDEGTHVATLVGWTTED